MTGVVADDTTGALDIGVMFRRAGCSVQVFTRPPSILPVDTDVVVVDTDSRLDPPSVAAAKVAEATRWLARAGAVRFHKKTCSVFRGNVGAEFDAMLDALGTPSMVVSAAYPLLGRTTREGMHQVNGQPIHLSQFRNDPVHPIDTSDLRQLLAKQSTRRSSVIPLETVRAGEAALRPALEREAKGGGYVIVDGETQQDLQVLARAAGGEFRIFGGSAGFAAEWPSGWSSAAGDVKEPPLLPSHPGGPLIVCGSLTPQSRTQTACLLDTGVDSATIAPWDGNCAELAPDDIEIAAKVAVAIRSGRSVLLMTEQDPSKVAAAQEKARKRGSDPSQLGRELSLRLASIVEAVFAAAEPSSLIVAGGDTSGSITRRLGINGCRLLGEVSPGVPACLTLGRETLAVFKSGSFGSPDFFLEALRHMQRLRLPRH